ncbi:MAG: DUF2848 family protein [Bacillota bacterium]
MNGNFYSLDVDGQEETVLLKSCYCIGYTGRNKEMTLKHIEELAELGIPEPDEIPSLYSIRTSSLTQGKLIEVIGNESTGEAEIVLVFGDQQDEVYVTVGSDHTDRGLETVDINKSKHVCDKPFAAKAWRLRDVRKNWDQLELATDVKTEKGWELYQKQTLSAIIPLDEIIAFLQKKNVEMKNTIIFSGTVPLVDGFKYGRGYRMYLSNPVNEDIISFEYIVKNLIG